MDFSRSRYGTVSGFLPSWSLIPTRTVVLVEGEDHGLGADREVAPLGEALVVLGHEDAAVVGVVAELDAEHVVDLALLEVRARPEVADGLDLRVVHAHARLHPQPLDALHRQELVVDPEPRLVRQVVAAVEARQGLERLARGRFSGPQGGRRTPRRRLHARPGRGG